MTYENLDVYKRSMRLAIEVYAATKVFPKSEVFGMVSQLRRAAVSIPCNIAEGSARNSPKELIHFLGISRGSCAELQTLVELSEGIGLLEPNHELRKGASDVAKMLTGLLKTLKSKSMA